MGRSISYEVIDHPVYKYRLTQGKLHIVRGLDDVPVGPRAASIRAGTTTWATLHPDGVLAITLGYAWDGASGPTLDTVSALRASLVHDVLYQLIAHGELPLKPWKKIADNEFRRILREDGMNWFRAQRWYWAVRLFGRGRDKYRPV